MSEVGTTPYYPYHGVMKENKMYYPIPCTECKCEMTEARNFDEVGRPLCPECA